MIKKINKKGFSILEILVGIFIFSMGIISIYSVIITTLKLSDYNKNYIIAANLAREQVELVRNIRDSNYNKISSFNSIKPGSTTKFEFGKYYKIENDYSNNPGFPIKVEDITVFGEGKNELNGKMLNYNLCLDSENRYTFDCNNSNKKTKFYKYVKIEKVEYNDGSVKSIDDAFKVTSKVIWYIKGYHEFEMKSIITDYKRL